MQKTYYIFLALSCLVCLGIGFFVRGLLLPESAKEASLSLKDVKGEGNSKEGTKNACDFFIDVSGAVMNPGVVCLNEGAIVNDAIVKAEGFNPSAYAFKYVAQRINLARILENEEKIYIPFRDDVVCKLIEDEQVVSVGKVMKSLQGGLEISKEIGAGKEEDLVGKVPAPTPEDSDCININSASKEKIMELKGIGEAKAGDILEGRPYSKLEDLKNVKGIGEKTFENLEPFICL